MKNLLYFCLMTFFCVLLYACKKCPECPDPDYGPGPTLTLQDTISVNKYDTWVSNWKNHGQSYIDNTLTEYFTMPMVDINEFKAFPGSGRDSVVSARFVLGLEVVGVDTIPHLMLLGVNAAGQSLTDASKHQYIYDVTQPCPNACGVAAMSK